MPYTNLMTSKKSNMRVMIEFSSLLFMMMLIKQDLEQINQVCIVTRDSAGSSDLHKKWVNKKLCGG